MDKTLELNFKNAAGKNARISMPDPKMILAQMKCRY